MRIAFLLAWRGGIDSGPFRKISSQVNAWIHQGHEVGLFVAGAPEATADWERVGATHLDLSASTRVGKLGERQKLARAALTWRPDVVYERHGLYYPGHRRLAATVPVVTEINGNDLGEWSLQSPTKALYNRLTRNLGLSNVAGLVFVTTELRDSDYFRRWTDRVPSLVLGNGINLQTVTRVDAVTTDGPPRFVFVGHHSSPWHGVEDVVALARARPDWHFDIIGIPPSQLPDAPSNLVGHGQMHPEKYADTLAAAEVGIGSLGLYREGISEASTLKVREYLAAGLPVVLGGRDTDFPDGAPFLLQVPNAPGAVVEAGEALVEFVAKWRGQRVPLEDIRHLDVTSKEARRLSFFAEVVHQVAAR